MRKVRTLLLLGIWVAILPYLGFPHSWKDVLGVITGLVIIGWSYLMHKEFQANETREDFENFSENSDFRERV